MKAVGARLAVGQGTGPDSVDVGYLGYSVAVDEDEYLNMASHGDH